MFRILSPTAILGYGFPETSFRKAMELKIDLIGVDAGSVDAGPYYLGAGKPYVSDLSLERDLKILIKGAIFQKCPLIIGSAGFSGSADGLWEVAGKVKNIIENEHISGTRLAVVTSDVSFDLFGQCMKDLVPMGKLPEFSISGTRPDNIVGQMGVEPIIAALESGARFIVCGRAYDPAVFAADPIRKGYPRGLCYHAGKILECGAIACEPGSGSDCLIAELDRDGSAIFYPTNLKRKATVRSIASHTLYEKSRPDIFHLPGGVLDIRKTKFFRHDSHSAGFSGSNFIEAPPTIKLEGCTNDGERVVSVLPLISTEKIDNDILVYGRNGVSSLHLQNGEDELGLICIARSNNSRHASTSISLLRSTMLHYGYEGRLSTAGNLAFPFSPSDTLIRESNGRFCGVLIAGSRDPVFIEKWRQIFDKALLEILTEYPELKESCEFEFICGNNENPVAILENIECDLPKALEAQKKLINEINCYVDPDRSSFRLIHMGSCYHWTLHHLTYNKKVITNIFKLALEDLTEKGWKPIEAKLPKYQWPLNPETAASTIEVENQQIFNKTPRIEMAEENTAPLVEMAEVIRSKNAGINLITFDILFARKADFEKAMNSGLFTAVNLSKTIGIKEKRFAGVYAFKPALAIKFTIERDIMAGDPGDRDVFGAQQYNRLLGMRV